VGLTRSQVMSRIKGTGTKPEELLRKALWSAGYRYKRDGRVGRIRPDVVLSKQRVAIFVDGCFWHGCPEHYVRPRSGNGFWASKLVENVERDIVQTAKLEAEGWRVVRFWEHAVFTSIGDLVIEVNRVASGGPRQGPDWRVWRVEAVLPDDPGQAESLQPEVEVRQMKDLRSPTLVRVEERRRTTHKW